MSMPLSAVQFDPVLSLSNLKDLPARSYDPFKAILQHDEERRRLGRRHSVG